MIIKLSGLDRLNIINSFLPAIQTGDFMTFQSKEELTRMLSIKTDEFEDYGLEQIGDGGIKWDERINNEKEYDLNKHHIAVLKQGHNILNKDKSLNDRLYITSKKIVGIKDEDDKGSDKGNEKGAEGGTTGK